MSAKRNRRRPPMPDRNDLLLVLLLLTFCPTAYMSAGAPVVPTPATGHHAARLA